MVRATIGKAADMVRLQVWLLGWGQEGRRFTASLAVATGALPNIDTHGLTATSNNSPSFFRSGGS